LYSAQHNTVSALEIRYLKEKVTTDEYKHTIQYRYLPLFSQNMPPFLVKIINVITET
jgi:hypothetical protein